MSVPTPVAFRWIEHPAHDESLPACLTNLLAARGASAAYDELLALLGLGNLIAASPAEALGVWPALARDRRLPAVAALLGLVLRPLHPADAARGLSESAEFPLHFRDSYAPLIARALDVGQLVLCWRGWPPPREPLWGVISERHGELLAGHSLWHRGEPMPLIGSAQQCYVVEDYRAPGRPLAAGERFDEARRAALSHWTPCAAAEAASAGPLVGRAAWDAWIGEIAAPSERTRGAAPLARQIADGARALAGARRCAAAWLAQIGPALAPAQRDVATDWARALSCVGDRLEPACEAEDVRIELRSGSAATAARFAAARDAEAAAMQALREAGARG